MSYKFPSHGEKKNDDELPSPNNTNTPDTPDIEEGIETGTTMHNEDSAANEETIDENITIQIMNPTPVNSLNLSDSSELEHLFNSNYQGNDNISKEIRRATASTNTDTSDYLFNHTRVEIKQKLNATIVRDINDTIRWRFLFRKCGNYFEFLSLVTSLISTVFAFSAGSFDNPYLAFTAGCLGSVSLAFMKATSYAMKESKERNEQLNIILDKAHIKYMPSLIQAES